MIAKKILRTKRATTSQAPEPPPMPPVPPGPTTHVYHKSHGTTALTLLLLITSVTFLAMSLGLSIFNTIELAKLKGSLVSVAKDETPAQAVATTAGTEDPDQLMIQADDLIDKAEALMQRAGAVDATGTVLGDSTTN